MPKFKLTHPDTGETLVVSMDSAPTQEDVADIFASRTPAPTPATPPGMGDVKVADIDPMQQAVEASSKVAEGFVPPPASPGGYPTREVSARDKELLAAGAGMLAAAPIAPAAGAGMLASLGTMALGGAVAGGTSALATEAMADTQEGGLLGSAGRVAKESFLGAGLGAISYPVIKAIGAAAKMGGELFTSGPRAVAARMFSPKTPHPGAMEADQARNVIKNATGIDVPMGVGEAIGNPSLATEIVSASPGAELTQAARDALKRTVVFTATNLRNAGASSDDLAKETVRVLQSEVGRIAKPAEQAIEDLSKELHTSLKKGFDDVLNEATTTIPGTSATPLSAGTRIKDALSRGYAEFKATDAANYNAARALPEHESLVVGTKNTRAWANSLEDSTIQKLETEAPEEFSILVDPFGRGIPKGAAPAETGGAVPSFLPEGTQKIVGGVKQMSEEQTLQAMRNMRTKIGDSIDDSAILPGLSEREKKAAYAAITQDINEAIDSLPTGELKSAYQKANAYHKENVDRFVGRATQGAIKDVGAAGGTSPENLASKLLGKDGATQLNLLRESAGPNQVAEINNAAREFLFNHVSKNARNAVTEELSVGSLVNNIDGLSPEIQAEFFPGLAVVKRAANREAALQGVKPATILKTLDIDPDLLQKAFQGDAAAVSGKLQAAVKASAKAQQQFKGSVLDALREGDSTALSDAVARNPGRFVRTVLDGGTFSPDQTKRAMDVVFREHPTVGGQLQFQAVDDLLSTFTSAEGINMQRLAEALKPESKLGKSGVLREHIKAVLGDGTFSTLESTVKSLAALDKVGSTLTPQSPLLEVAAKGIGGLLGSVAGPAVHAGSIGSANAAAWLTRLAPKLKYRVAATILTTPELRQLASQPVNRITAERITQIAAATAKAIAASEGSDSPDIYELQTSLPTR